MNDIYFNDGAIDKVEIENKFGRYIRKTKTQGLKLESLDNKISISILKNADIQVPSVFLEILKRGKNINFKEELSKHNIVLNDDILNKLGRCFSFLV